MKLKNITAFHLPALKKRSNIHFFILLSVLSLLLLILLLLYNEIVNERKLKQYFSDMIQLENKFAFLQESEKEYVISQESLFDYFISNNSQNLNDYFNALKEVKKNLTYLTDTTFVPHMIPTENMDGPNEYSSLHLIQYIDSAYSNHPYHYKNKTNVFDKLKQNAVDDILLNTYIESKITIDSVHKKSLIKRIGDAIKGNVDIQVEKEDILVTMKYGKSASIGSIEDQLKKSMEWAIHSYEREKQNLSSRFTLLDDKNKQLVSTNDSIRKYSNLFFNNYKNTLKKVKEISKTNYDQQYVLNRSIRLTAISILIIFLILLSFLALYLTKINYEFEVQLLKAKDKLSENLLFKNRIVSMISHEVRSPLSTIGLYIKQILKREKNKKNIEVFDSINFSINSILLLTTQILEFSKGENTSLKLVLSEFDLHKEIENIIKTFEPLAASKGNKLIKQNKVQNPLILTSDISKIHQLFYNLIGNAIKNTSKGSITIHCEAHENQDHEVKFKLQIKDTGKGISKEELNKVFDLHHHGVNTDFNFQNFGVGLGLHLCKEIVDLFHGDIQIESELNLGTQVLIEMNIQNKVP